MRDFEEIFDLAAARHGGAAALEAMLEKPKPPEALAAIPDDRWLSCFAKCVFQAGFSWTVIEAKWPGFEEAFHGFDPGWCSHVDGDRFDALVADARIVRNAAKIHAVRDNAVLILGLAAEHGAAARCFADWPAADFAGLLAMLKARGGRLGGLAGARAMRMMGKDSWLLSPSVVARLTAEGVPTGASKKAQGAVQAAFDGWAAQSGRSFTEISRILALSIEG